MLVEQIDNATQQLKKSINNKSKQKLQEICDDYDEMCALEAENAFSEGVILGVQLMSEAYARR